MELPSDQNDLEEHVRIALEAIWQNKGNWPDVMQSIREELSQQACHVKSSNPD